MYSESPTFDLHSSYMHAVSAIYIVVWRTRAILTQRVARSQSQMRTAQTTVHAIRSTRRCGSSLGVHARQHTAHLLDQLLLDNCLVMSKFEWFSPSTARTSWMIEMSEENQASTSELQDDVLQMEGFPTCQRVAKGTCEAARGESAREESVRTVRAAGPGITSKRRYPASTERRQHQNHPHGSVGGQQPCGGPHVAPQEGPRKVLFCVLQPVFDRATSYIQL